MDNSQRQLLQEKLGAARSIEDTVGGNESTLISDKKSKFIRDYAKFLGKELKAAKKFPQDFRNLDNKDITDVIKLIKKTLPDPKKQSFSKEAQVKKCMAAAKFINNYLGRKVIDLSMGARVVCESLRDVVNSMISISTEEIEVVHQDVGKLANNMELLLQYLKKSRNSLLEKSKERGYDIKQESFYHTMEKIIRKLGEQIQLLRGISDNLQENVNIDIDDIMAEARFFEGELSDLGEPGTSKFAKEMVYMFNHIGTVSQLMGQIQKALKKVGMSYGKYRSIDDIGELVSELSKLEFNKLDEMTAKDIVDFQKAAELLKQKQFLKDDITKHLDRIYGKKGRGEHYGMDEHIGGITLDKRVKRRDDARKRMLDSFNNRMGDLSKRLYNTAEKIGQSVYAGQITPNEHLRKFVSMLQLLPDLGKRRSFFSIAGVYDDIRSRQERERFLSIMDNVINAAQPLKKEKGGNYINDFVKLLENMAETIESFADKFSQGFAPLEKYDSTGKVVGNADNGDNDNSDNKSKKSLSGKIGKYGKKLVKETYKQGKEVLRQKLNRDHERKYGQDESDSMEVDNDNMDVDMHDNMDVDYDEDEDMEDIIRGDMEKLGGDAKTKITALAKNIDGARKMILYYYRIEKQKRNMYKTSNENKHFSKMYREVLGKAIANEKDKIVKHRSELKNNLTKGKDYTDPLGAPNYDIVNAVVNGYFNGYNDEQQHRYHDLLLSTIEADDYHKAIVVDDDNITNAQNRINEDYKNIVEYHVKREQAREGLYSVAEAVDLYLIEFTNALTANPDDLQDIVSILGQSEIIAQPFTKHTGDDLTRVFESFPGYAYKHDGEYNVNGYEKPYEYITDNSQVKRAYSGLAYVNKYDVHYYEEVRDRCLADAPGAPAPGTLFDVDANRGRREESIAGRAVPHGENAGDVYAFSMPGNPFLSTYIYRKNREKFSVHSAVENVQNVLSSGILKNLISVFVSVGGEFGGKKVMNKTSMPPKKIYQNLIEYIKYSSFTGNESDHSNYYFTSRLEFASRNEFNINTDINLPNNDKLLSTRTLAEAIPEVIRGSSEYSGNNELEITGSQNGHIGGYEFGSWHLYRGDMFNVYAHRTRDAGGEVMELYNYFPTVVTDDGPMVIKIVLREGADPIYTFSSNYTLAKEIGISDIELIPDLTVLTGQLISRDTGAQFDNSGEVIGSIDNNLFTNVYQYNSTADGNNKIVYGFNFRPGVNHDTDTEKMIVIKMHGILYAILDNGTAGQNTQAVVNAEIAIPLNNADVVLAHINGNDNILKLNGHTLLSLIELYRIDIARDLNPGALETIMRKNGHSNGYGQSTGKYIGYILSTDKIIIERNIPGVVAAVDIIFNVVNDNIIINYNGNDIPDYHPTVTEFSATMERILRFLNSFIDLNAYLDRAGNIRGAIIVDVNDINTPEAGADQIEENIRKILSEIHANHSNTIAANYGNNLNRDYSIEARYNLIYSIREKLIPAIMAIPDDRKQHKELLLTTISFIEYLRNTEIPDKPWEYLDIPAIIINPAAVTVNIPQYAIHRSDLMFVLGHYTPQSKSHAFEAYMRPINEYGVNKKFKDDEFKKSDEIFVMIIKSMVAKCLTSIGAYNMYHRPLHEAGIGSYNDMRTIIGASDMVPKIIPEAIDLYARLLYMAEYYRDLFDFESDNSFDYRNENIQKKITMIPEMGGLFSGLVYIVFDKSSSKEGTYSLSEFNSIIEQINKIYMHYKNDSDPIGSAIDEFIHEMNRRYGVATDEEMKAYKDERKRRYKTSSNDNSQFVYEYELETMNESDTYDRLAPSDSYRKMQGRKYDDKRDIYKIDLDDRKRLYRIREKIQKGFDDAMQEIVHQNDTENKLDKLEKFSLDKRIESVKRQVKKAEPKEQHKLVLDFLNSMVGFVPSTLEEVLVSFHEFYVFPLNNLYSLYKQIERFKKVIFEIGEACDLFNEININDLKGGLAIAGDTYTNAEITELLDRIVANNGLPQDESKQNKIKKHMIGFATNLTEYLRNDVVNLDNIPPLDNTYYTSQEYLDNTPADFDYSTDKHSVYDKVSMAQVFFETIAMVGSIDDKLVKVQSDSRNSKVKIMVDFSNMIQYVYETLEDLKQQLNIYRAILPQNIIKKYESFKNADGACTLYDIEKKFVEEVIEGRTDTGENIDPLGNCNKNIMKIIKFLTKNHNNRRQNYGRLLEQFIYNSGKVNTTGGTGNAGIYTNLATLGEDRLFTMLNSANSSIPGYDPNAANVNHTMFGIFDVNATTITLKRENQNVGHNRHLLYTFNNMIYELVNRFYDVGVSKIYKPLVEGLIYGTLGEDIKNKSHFAFHGNGVANLTNNDPDYQPFTNMNILYADTLHILKCIREKITKKGEHYHLEEDISEISTSTKDTMKVYGPEFVKIFTAIIKRCTLLRDFAEAFRANHELVLAGNNIPFNTINEQTPLVLAKIRNACLDAISGIRETLDHIGEIETIAEPTYKFTENYKTIEGELPFLPMSVLQSTLVRKNAHFDVNVNYNSLSQPFASHGTPEYQFVRYKRNIEDYTLDLHKTNKQILEDHNYSVEKEIGFEKKFIEKFFARNLCIYEYVNDVYNIMELLSSSKLFIQSNIDSGTRRNLANAVYTAEGRGGGNPPRVPIRTNYLYKLDMIPYKEEGGNISRNYATVFIGIEENAQNPSLSMNEVQRNGRSRLKSNISNHIHTDTTNDIERKHIRAFNFIDINRIPINVHALTREMPLVNLYNYSFTFDRLVKQTFGIDYYYEHDVMMVDKNDNIPNDARYVDNEYTKKPIIHYQNIRNTKHFMGELLIDPYRRIDGKAYMYYVKNMAIGRTGIQGLGRPKFFAHEVFNKSLFGSLYNDGYDMGSIPPENMSIANLEMNKNNYRRDRHIDNFVENEMESFYYMNDNNEPTPVDMTTNSGAANYDNVPKRLLKEYGKLRFDTKLVRNLLFIENSMRLLTLKLRRDLTYYNNPVLTGNSLLAPSVTETFGRDTPLADNREFPRYDYKY